MALAEPFDLPGKDNNDRDEERYVSGVDAAFSGCFIVPCTRGGCLSALV